MPEQMPATNEQIEAELAKTAHTLTIRRDECATYAAVLLEYGRDTAGFERECVELAESFRSVASATTTAADIRLMPSDAILLFRAIEHHNAKP